MNFAMVFKIVLLQHKFEILLGTSVIYLKIHNIELLILYEDSSKSDE